MGSNILKQLPAVNNLNLKPTDIAWLAGLFEGEASFLLDKRSKQRYKISTWPNSPYISIQMVDKDVIARVDQLVNKRYVILKRKTIQNKFVYKVHIGDRSTLRYLLPLLLPYLGTRRQDSVQLCLNVLNEWETWYLEGGRSQMAKLGPKTKKSK